MLSQTLGRGACAGGLSCRLSASRHITTSEKCTDVTSSTPIDPSKKSVDGHLIPEKKRSGLLSSFKAGTGGRASFSGNVVTVFGANGWMGRAVVNRIAKDGTQIIVPYRCDPYFVKDLKVSCELGQLLFFPFEMRDEEAIRKAVKYSNVVVNLAGSMHETPNYSFYDVHAEGAARLARICKEMGVDRFIHVSALGASHTPEAKLIPGGSHFLRSKAKGEDAVREIYPHAIIVRPGACYGFYDRFAYLMLTRTRKNPSGFIGVGVLEMHEGGRNTYKMPVYLNDISSGIARLVQDASWDGQTLEFVGQHCYNLREIADMLQHIQGAGMGSDKLGYENQPFYIMNGYSFRTILRMNFFEAWSYWRKQSPLLSAEMLEYYEAVSDKLTGVKTLSDVIGVENMHDFEYTVRQWAIQFHWAFCKRQHFNEGLQPNKLNKFAPLYATRTPKPVDPTFAAFDTTLGGASPFGSVPV